MTPPARPVKRLFVGGWCHGQIKQIAGDLESVQVPAPFNASELDWRHAGAPMDTTVSTVRYELVRFRPSFDSPRMVKVYAVPGMDPVYRSEMLLDALFRAAGLEMR